MEFVKPVEIFAAYTTSESLTKFCPDKYCSFIRLLLSNTKYYICKVFLKELFKVQRAIMINLCWLILITPLQVKLRIFEK